MIIVLSQNRTQTSNKFFLEVYSSTLEFLKFLTIRGGFLISSFFIRNDEYQLQNRRFLEV